MDALHRLVAYVSSALRHELELAIVSKPLCPALLDQPQEMCLDTGLGIAVPFSLAGGDGVIEVGLDGKDLKYDMNANRVKSDFFNITYIKDNFFQAPVGTFRSTVDGHYLS